MNNKNKQVTEDAKTTEILNLSKNKKDILRNLCLFSDIGIDCSLFNEWTGIEKTEDITNLIEKELVILESNTNHLTLNKKISDICFKHFKPNGENCKNLLSVMAGDLEDVNASLIHGNIPNIENLFLSIALKIEGDSEEIKSIRTKTLNYCSGEHYDEATKLIYEIWLDNCKQTYGEISQEVAYVLTVWGENRWNTQFLLDALDIYENFENTTEIYVKKLYINALILNQHESRKDKLYSEIKCNIKTELSKYVQVYGLEATYTYCKLSTAFDDEFAEDICKRAIVACKNIDSTNSVHAFALSNLAFNYYNSNNYDEANKMYKKALNILIAIPNIDKTFIAKVIFMLYCTALETKDIIAATNFKDLYFSTAEKFDFKNIRSPFESAF